MQKRTIKMLVLSGALAATATIAAARLQQQNFSDIPAGHWAREAVQAIAAEGLITGYQDGTFQGQRTLTRYEAATIFYRLLRSGRLQNATPATQTAAQQGMSEVSPELTALTTRVTELEASNDTRIKALEDRIQALGNAAPAAGATPAATTDFEARIKAVEDEIAALKAAPAAAPAAGTTTTEAAPAALSPEAEARIKTLEDQVAALRTAAPAATPAATGPSTTDLEARLKALEDRVAAQPAAAPAATAPAATGPSTTDLETRIRALETAAAAAPAAATPSADVTALRDTVTAQDARIRTLEGAVTSLQADVSALKTAAAAAPAPSPTPSTTSGSSATTTTVGTPEATGPVTRFSVALGGATTITGPVGAGASPFGLYGQVSLTNLAGPIGIRAFADLSSVPTAGAQLLVNLGDAGFDPYLGVGAGLDFGGGGLFIAGTVGANLGFGGGLGAFAEINPRYSLGGNGFSVKAALGLRFSF
jgi:uncharacterized coiled-coil protein SlyX